MKSLIVLWSALLAVQSFPTDEKSFDFGESALLTSLTREKRSNSDIEEIICGSTVASEISSCILRSFPSTVTAANLLPIPAGGNMAVVSQWCSESTLPSCFATLSSCAGDLDDVLRMTADPTNYRTAISTLCSKRADYNASIACYWRNSNELRYCNSKMMQDVQADVQNLGGQFNRQAFLSIICRRAQSAIQCVDDVVRPSCGARAADVLKTFNVQTSSMCPGIQASRSSDPRQRNRTTKLKLKREATHNEGEGYEGVAGLSLESLVGVSIF